jgi:hypothetical protein
MTLLTTEIVRARAGDVVIFAADRRITRGTLPDGNRKKIFRIPNRQAGIGYFGLAEIPLGSSIQPMSEWIQDFFFQLKPSDDLESIAQRLAAELNTAVPKSLRDAETSGFHLAGLAADGRAEFWFVRNIDDNFKLTQSDYQIREEFKSRDALALPQGALCGYRNGDIRAHVVAWEKIDESFGSLLGTPSFRPLTTIGDYVDWVKFKMELVAAFYEHFAMESIIGSPVDAFAFPDAA